MDPSGTFVQFDAKAIGSGSEGAQQSLQDVYHKSMTLQEATTAALTILKQVMEEKLNSTNVEVMTMTPEKLFHMFEKEQVEEVSIYISFLLFSHLLSNSLYEANIFTFYEPWP